MITRRPYSRTATRRDTPAQDPRNTQVTAGQVKDKLRGGQTVIRIEFAAPSPLGLLGPGARASP